MAVPAVLIGAIGASTGDLMIYILLLLLRNQIGSLKPKGNQGEALLYNSYFVCFFFNMRQLTNYILQKENEKKVFSNFSLNMNYEIYLFSQVKSH